MFSAINLKKLATSLLIPLATGFLSWLFTNGNMEIYQRINVPPLSPASILFPIVWSVLYLLMSVSLYIVTKKDEKTNTRALIVYGVQLIINSLWSLIFFGFGAYLFAFIWILLLIISIIVMMVTFFKIDKRAFYLNIPYLLWSIFAGYLTLGIYMLNK